MRLQLSPDRVTGPWRDAIIEPGAVCSLRCPFCPTGNGDLHLNKTLLTPGAMARLLDALGPGLKRLDLFNWGEPLLHPRICGLIREASGRGIAATIHTHLSIPAFDARRARELVDSGLSELVVSCDGAGQESYARYRVGGDFGLVMRNLRLILSARSAAASATPLATWKFLVHRGNSKDVPAAKRLAAALGIPIQFKPLIVPPDQARDWSARAAPSSAPPSRAGAICLGLWDTPVIHADGTVLPCCVVNDPRWSLGNALREDLGEVFNKPLIVAMRRYIKSGKPQAAQLPCHGCPHDPHGRNWPGVAPA